MMIVKTMVNLVFVVKAQVIVLDNYAPEGYNGSDCDVYKYHYYVIVLVFECAYFYLNILSIFLFIAFSRIFEFSSLKDRAGFGGNNKKMKDFLEHASADIYWFTTAMSSIMLGGYVVKMHYQN